MSTTIKGLAVIWGVNLSTTATDAIGGGYVLGTSIITGYDFAFEANSKEILNSIGDCASLVFSNYKRVLNLQALVAGATIAAAKTNNVIPEPGMTVRIVDPDSPDVDGVFTGDYTVQTSSKTAAQDSEVRMTLGLVQYRDNNLKNTVAA
jgi:hypothetical protein